MRIVLLAFLLVVIASCAKKPGPASVADATEETVPQAPACEPLNTNNYGTQVQDVCAVDNGVWQETNGICALPETESCDGPADQGRLVHGTSIFRSSR